MLQNSNTIQPKVVVIRRRPNQGFGFTLRHFIAYPPEDDPSWPETSNSYQRKAMETIFIKEVQTSGPACFAGLQTGDRVLMVNNIPIAGISYSLIVSMIKQTPSVLTLHVVPKECDVLQMHYTIAHTPESNRLAKSATLTLPGSGGVASVAAAAVAASASSHKSIHQQMISYPVGSSRSKQNTKSILSSEDYHDLGGRYSPLLLHGDSTFSRSKAPPNLSVLPRTAADNDLMIRLRESIKQKEEFLKSPLPHTQPNFFHSQQQPMPMTAARGQVVVKNAAAKQQQQQPITRDLLPASCDMQNFYAKNLPPNLADSMIMRTAMAAAAASSSGSSSGSSNNRSGDIMKTTIMRYRNMSSTGSSGSMSGASSSSSTMKDKFHKELEYLESLPEMGVTNQVFERKLVSTRAKGGFDPFKPLTINTSLDPSVLNKPVMYDSVVQQCVVDGQKNSRMEIYKANVASAGMDEYHVPNKYTSVSKTTTTVENHRTESKQSLTDIAEAGDMPSIPASSEVVRRYKPINIDDNKPMRRISYLRATNNEIEYNTDVTTTTTTPTASEISDAESKRTSINSEIRDSIHIENVPEINGKLETKDVATEVEVFETEMEVKSSCIYGKRMSEYRSWRQVKIEIKGDILKIYSGRSSKTETNVIELDVRNFNIVDESADKKKYLFRLQSKPRVQNNLTTSSSSSSSASVPASGNTDLLYDEAQEKLSSSSSSTATNNNSEHTEIVFKTKSATEMKRIFNLLREKCNMNNSDTDLKEKQLAEPQKTAATTTMPTITYCDDNVQQQQQQQQEYSPQSSTSRGGDIETESISPVMKSRKSQHKNLPDKDLGSPKAKNWKDLLFRRNHGTSTADISPSTLSSSSKTTGSIGVPLRTCPMSKSNEYVPLIVDVCTNIVETKGLSVIGIYRIPGNKAAISELKDQVNKTDFSWDRCNTDVRWEDVNVVSSLLKLFIRSLPDALLPSNFYNHFIEADKKIGLLRLRELKDLLRSLPRNSYETMKHLIRHLSRVSKNCHINLMEPKNLAIIFGPSIIRTPNETLEIAVKDMKHQCRIVELLLTQYDYFFEDGELPEIEANAASITSSSTSSSHQDQTSLLLDNVSKIERINDRESLTSRLIPHLRRRTHSKRSAVSSDTYSGESVLSLEYGGNKKTSDSPPAASTPTSKDKQQAFENASKERHSVDNASILTDEESSNSRISDSGSMSLTTITDTLDTKLRNLRSGSESNDENGSPNRQRDNFARRHTFGQPLILHENIPYADESPERHHHNEMTNFKTFASRNSAIVRDFPKNIRFSSVYEAACSDDSEGSTTSDPKEALIISSPSFFLERYKKRRDHRLFRSASFNCRNYSNRSAAGGGGGGAGGVGVGNGAGGGGGTNTGTVGCNNSALTKDEKTDMNLTKKRQIQNKQNRSIKRRHTVGGPHDYTATTVVRRAVNGPPLQQLTSGGVVVPSNGSGNNVADHVLEVGIRIKNVNRRY